jgi:toxin-antitoxin system PIN domain toxin
MMFLPDVNVLLYAIDSSTPQHPRCRDWLNEALNAEEPVGWAWNVLLGFLRISTSPIALATPLTITQAFAYVEEWLAQPPSRIVDPSVRHGAVLRGLLEAGGFGGNTVSDAHLAALAIEYQGQVCSCDTDFGRFPGLAWFNPLAVSAE